MTSNTVSLGSYEESYKSDTYAQFQELISTRTALCTHKNSSVDKNERESTRRAKDRLVAIYGHYGYVSVSVAVRYAGISRDTYYRYLREDANFAAKINEAQEFLNDYVEDLLLKKIVRDENIACIKFYLSHRHPAYRK